MQLGRISAARLGSKNRPPLNGCYALKSGLSTAIAVWSLSADIVAKIFFASRRSTLIQQITLSRKIDSS
jgi:hypothetical protein